MECVNGGENAYSRQILTFETVKATLLRSSIVGLYLFSQPSMWVQVISMIDQRWINDVSLASPLPPLAAPNDSLLKLAPPHQRNRDRDKQTETEKRSNSFFTHHSSEFSFFN